MTADRLEIVYRNPADLKPDPKNMRTHSPEQVEQLRASIAESGLTGPILLDATDTVRVGNGRLAAVLLLGWSEIHTITKVGLSAEQWRKLAIADNRIALNAGWNEELLRAELGELHNSGIDLGSLGFDLGELGDLQVQGFVKEEDTRRLPEPAQQIPKNPISKRGDLWLLGRHRLICGDSSDQASMAKLFNGTGIDMVLTDPPYCSGGFQEAGKGAGSVGTRGSEMVANDTLSSRGYSALMKSVIPTIGAGVVYAFTDWRMWLTLFDVIESSGYGVRNMIVWDKETPGMGAGWRMQHELIMCGIAVKSPFDPKKAQGNVIRCKRSGNINHATEKPVELLVKVIEVTDMAKTVCDPFNGSGSTMLACELTDRTYFGSELTPGYTDVTVGRWELHTGLKATLDGDGRTFEEIKAERLAKKKKAEA
jgi:DNA modification methylase